MSALWQQTQYGYVPKNIAALTYATANILIWNHFFFQFNVRHFPSHHCSSDQYQNANIFFQNPLLYLAASK